MSTEKDLAHNCMQPAMTAGPWALLLMGFCCSAHAWLTYTCLHSGKTSNVCCFL